MLGQPLYMLVPEVVGVRLHGELPEGATATDLVLTVTQMLRKHGVVGKFVEYFGPGVGRLPVADRATIGNMSPEYGATAGYFPVDDATLAYLRTTGRSAELVDLVERYTKEQGLFRTDACRADLRRHAGAGPGDGRAEHGRAAPPAGPGLAGGGRRRRSTRRTRRSLGTAPAKEQTRPRRRPPWPTRSRPRIRCRPRRRRQRSPRRTRQASDCRPRRTTWISTPQPVAVAISAIADGDGRITARW